MASGGRKRIDWKPNPFVIGCEYGQSCDRKRAYGRPSAQQRAAEIGGHAYHCRRCGAWHATGKDVRAWAIGGNR
jgi:hypothetical protein